MHLNFMLIIGAVAAYWVYNDARRLGREQGTALLWALGTVPLPFIILPLYLVLGRRQPAVRRPPEVVDIEAVPVEETMYCPMCGRKVKEEYQACPYCSHTLRPKCTSCGRELRRDWKICPYCEAPATGK
jgi:RNA polymerase subunit RPABC4/transcription elongation factor Spt4